MNILKIDKPLGFSDFAPTLLCQTTEYEELWDWLYFGAFDGPEF